MTATLELTDRADELDTAGGCGCRSAWVAKRARYDGPQVTVLRVSEDPPEAKTESRPSGDWRFE
jgi:hypothetical protein